LNILEDIVMIEIIVITIVVAILVSLYMAFKKGHSVEYKSKGITGIIGILLILLLSAFCTLGFGVFVYLNAQAPAQEIKGLMLIIISAISFSSFNIIGMLNRIEIKRDEERYNSSRL